MTIEAAKRIFNSDKICRSYSDLNFCVSFLEHSVYTKSNMATTRAHARCSMQEHSLSFTSRPAIAGNRTAACISFGKKYKWEKRASNIALSYGIDVDK